MSQQAGIARGTPVMSAIATGVAASTLLSGLQLAIGINAVIALATALVRATFLRRSFVSSMRELPYGRSSLESGQVVHTTSA